MMIALLLLSFTFIFLLFLLRRAPWKLRVSSIETLNELFIPISIPALTNLLAEENSEFLRQQLSPSDFRKCMRRRNEVFCVYLRRIAHNSRVLIALAEMQQQAEQDGTDERSRELLRAAMATRTQALYALATLYAGRVLPGLIADIPGAIQSYQSASSHWRQFRAGATH